jgi:hypothetical protein
MAQGEDHGAEIGARFKRWGEMTEAEQDAMLAGYATIHYHPVRTPDED